MLNTNQEPLSAELTLVPPLRQTNPPLEREQGSTNEGSVDRKRWEGQLGEQPNNMTHSFSAIKG